MTRSDCTISEEKDPRAALDAFVSMAKVNAFVSKYQPCLNPEEPEVEVFDERSLRKFFGAYPRTIGDPLAVYLDNYLEPRGYRMQVDQIIGEPVIYVTKKY